MENNPILILVQQLRQHEEVMLYRNVLNFSKKDSQEVGIFFT